MEVLHHWEMTVDVILIIVRERYVIPPGTIFMPVDGPTLISNIVSKLGQIVDQGVVYGYILQLYVAVCVRLKAVVEAIYCDHDQVDHEISVRRIDLRTSVLSRAILTAPATWNKCASRGCGLMCAF